MHLQINLEKINKLISKDKKVKVVSRKLWKNLNVLYALKISSEDKIFILDIDCQDPQEFSKR